MTITLSMGYYGTLCVCVLPVLWLLPGYLAFIDRAFLPPSRLPSMRNLCPRRDFCRSSAKIIDEGNDTMSCCQPCSCDADCRRHGNCCPDVPVSPREVLTPFYTCVTPAELLYGRTVNPYRRQPTWYRIIDTCPNSSMADPRCVTPDTLESNVPVSSVTGTCLYKNLYCARCHGETEYIRWSITAKCPDKRLMDTAFRDIVQRDAYVLENCELNALPPDGMDTSNLVCYDHVMIDQCNVTGMWAGNNAFIESACHEYANKAGTAAAFNHAFGQLGTVYANVYCALCNERYGERTDLCYYESVPKVDHPPPFTLVLAFPHGEVIQECAATDLKYDSVLKRCRQLYCPRVTLPVSGSCQPIGVTEGLYLSVHFDVKFKIPSLVDLPELHAYFEALSNYLEHIYFRDCMVDVCAVRLYDLGVEEYALQVTFINTKDCPFMKLMAFLNNVTAQHTVIQVPIEGGVIELVSIHVGETFSAREPSDISKQPHCGTSQPVTTSMMQICPRFRLEYSELRQAGLSEGTISSLYNARIADSDTESTSADMFVICVSDYVAIANSSVRMIVSTINTLAALQACLIWKLLV